MMGNKNYHWFIKILPLIGILGFILFYIYSTFLYPGGSDYDRKAIGFSWMHNYWCNLLEKTAINGDINLARPYAISSLISLCFGIGFFYYIFPRHFQMRKIWRVIIKSLGITSMLIGLFLFTKRHDLVVDIAGILGIIAIIGTLVALNRNNSPKLLMLGIICTLMIILNNYIYYTEMNTEYLPLIQKITIFLFIIWFTGISLVFRKD